MNNSIWMLIDAGILGMLSWWNVELDPISMAAMIISIGFSVDIPAHVAYHYCKASKHCLSTSLIPILYMYIYCIQAKNRHLRLNLAIVLPQWDFQQCKQHCPLYYAYTVYGLPEFIWHRYLCLSRTTSSYTNFKTF